MNVECAIFGWDVGGAHVKVSMLSKSGELSDIAQWPCPLWQGLGHLERVIDSVFERWPRARDPRARHAVTMTGEMVDLFADRAEGVRVLVDTLAQRLGPDTRFFAGPAGWLEAKACVAQWREVASANWLATAQWVAHRLKDAVLIDIGSTTTDIVPIVAGRAAARGCNDATRLVSGELVYQGVVRTPLCGVAHRIGFRGEEANVMNEWFATTADVYRLTGELWPAHDQHASADNGPKTQAASRARIARTIGRDARDADEDAWRDFAFGWREKQMQILTANLDGVIAAHPSLQRAPLVGAGCGRFLIETMAQDAGRAFIDFSDLADAPGADKERREWIATCAPSVAVARLTQHENTVAHPGA
ncbi:hydantoinase/oxoprolinase family protein [Caballeronia sp. dw_276]|jgi:probable H4MPT-linked C1 transfer pathway protein|uniref:hydantoinase/oxoprolinase family protein n=1 Tax=Caballeronia sp. dw_276 TaxID=2719795 RepID=UPI001BD3F96B|nr:hydantoinase/oxoprolinase family protein [Caballeronia sp. dw_276]